MIVTNLYYLKPWADVSRVAYPSIVNNLIFLIFLVFLGLHSWHMEIPRLGVDSEL